MTTSPFAEWGAQTDTGRGAGDQIIYYRRPRTGLTGEPVENAGWITWGDSLSGSKFRDYVRRRFDPLMQYGVINSREREMQRVAERWSPGHYIWGLILEHPQGPAEFPLAQIVTWRWYRPELCPVPDVYFPQLSGKKLQEYRCPTAGCNRRFVDIEEVGGVSGLGSHLIISHEWTRTDLNAYGDRVGIDFNKVDVANLPVEEYMYAGTESARQPERSRQPKPQVEVEVK